MDAEPDQDNQPMMTADPEINELLGLFDLPAFARRGQDLEFALKSLDARCRRHRVELLEPVCLRLRQWARAAGPESWRDVFDAPIDGLWPLSACPPPDWADRPASARQRSSIARDLVASVGRFNRRWDEFLKSLNLDPTNQVVDLYNKYYVLEKECVVGSARLAAWHFTPVPRVSFETLLQDFPRLPVPAIRGPGSSAKRPPG